MTVDPQNRPRSFRCKDAAKQSEKSVAEEHHHTMSSDNTTYHTQV